MKHYQGKSYPYDEVGKMIRTNKRNQKRPIELDLHFSLCKDFLCPPETRIREWFPSLLDARIRCHALDPYGLMKEMTRWHEEKGKGYFYICSNENCHAKIGLKIVDPDPEGNTFGIFGCISHQHPLPRKNKSQIIFKNKTEAEEFINKHLIKMYRIETTRIGSDWISYRCRRKYIKDGYKDCKSSFSISATFPQKKSWMPQEEKPYNLTGIFYHSHKNESKYHKNECGGYSFNDARHDPSKPPRIQYAFVRWCEKFKCDMVYPVKCRAYYTVEQVLSAQKKGKSLTVPGGSNHHSDTNNGIELGEEIKEM